MVTPSGVVGTVTMGAVDGAVVLAVTPGTDVGVTVGTVVVCGALDGVEVTVDAELGGVVVSVTDVDVEVGTDVTLVEVAAEVLVEVEPLVSVVGVEVAVEEGADVDVVSDVVTDVDVTEVVVVEVVSLVVLVTGAMDGGDNMIRGVSVTISGGTVACGSLASILTSACCTRLASAAFCCASPTSLTRAAATPSCC